MVQFHFPLPFSGMVFWSQLKGHFSRNFLDLFCDLYLCTTLELCLFYHNIQYGLLKTWVQLCLCDFLVSMEQALCHSSFLVESTVLCVERCRETKHRSLWESGLPSVPTSYGARFWVSFPEFHYEFVVCLPERSSLELGTSGSLFFITEEPSRR